MVEPFVALPPSSVHPNSNAALGTGLRRYDGIETLAAILRCRAGMTGWRAGARPPLPCQYVGLEGPCLSASQCPHQRRWPETRPPQAPPARHSGEGRNPDRRPALNQRALRARPRGRAVCGLATVERASKLKRRTGYRPSPVRRAGGTDQARWRLIRSSFRRTPESRSAPGYEPMCLPSKACGRAVCGLATVERASNLKRRTGYRPSPVRRN